MNQPEKFWTFSSKTEVKNLHGYLLAEYTSIQEIPTIQYLDGYSLSQYHHHARINVNLECNFVQENVVVDHWVSAKWYFFYYRIRCHETVVNPLHVH